MKTAPRVIKTFWSNGEEVLLRYPKIEDVDDIQRNVNSLVREKAFIGLQKRRTREQIRQYIEDRLKSIEQGNRVSLVAEIRGRVVGSATITRSIGDGKSHVGALGITLIKEARGRGIGKKLILAVIAEAKEVLGSKKIVLDPLVVNHRAVALYKKCGFKVIRIVRRCAKHSGKLRMCVRMEKRLR